MVGLMPIPTTLTGNRKVLTAEPKRLTAVARPIPLARTSVGKLSAGNTPTRLLTADSTRVKMPNASTIKNAALLGRIARINNATAKMMNELIKKPRRENFTVHQMPINAPTISSRLSISSVPKPSARPMVLRMDGRKV